VNRLAIILTLTVIAAAAVGVSPAGAGYIDPFAPRKCNAKVNANMKITQARNMSCRSARRVMRRYHGSVKRSFTAPSRFKCKLVKGRVVSGVWRCKKPSKAFRFAFGD
jgi:hypothetical protein